MSLRAMVGPGRPGSGSGVIPRADSVEDLVALQRRVSRLLERSARKLSDPEHGFELMQISQDCRDRARVLERHRSPRDPANEKGGASHGRGPKRSRRRIRPRQDIAEAHEVAAVLEKECAGLGRAAEDPSLRKLLEILSVEHRVVSHKLRSLLETTADGQ